MKTVKGLHFVCVCVIRTYQQTKPQPLLKWLCVFLSQFAAINFNKFAFIYSWAASSPSLKLRLKF